MGRSPSWRRVLLLAGLVPLLGAGAAVAVALPAPHAAVPAPQAAAAKAAAAVAGGVDPSLYGSLQWRNIGPYTGGRSLAGGGRGGGPEEDQLRAARGGR